MGLYPAATAASRCPYFATAALVSATSLAAAASSAAVGCLVSVALEPWSWTAAGAGRKRSAATPARPAPRKAAVRLISRNPLNHRFGFDLSSELDFGQPKLNTDSGVAGPSRLQGWHRSVAGALSPRSTGK